MFEVISIVVFTASFAYLLCSAFMPQIISIAIRKEWFDPIDHRKVHKTPTPRLGGVGFGLSFFVVALIFPWLLSLILSSKTPLSYYNLRYFSVLVSFFIVHIVGLVDDFKNIRAGIKLLFQILAASVAMVGGAVIHSFTLPFFWYTIELGLFAYPVTLLWFIGICNAVNLIDGLDGLAGGISFFASLFIGIVAILNHQYSVAILSFALAGGLFGFLSYNLPPAKTFMGDSGSLLLGQILATTGILALTPGEGSYSLYIPIALLILPITDVFVAIFRRKRKKISFATPDKEHIHHKMLSLGMSNRSILLVVYSLCIINGVSVVFWEVLSHTAGAAILAINVGVSFGVYGLICYRYALQKKILHPVSSQLPPLGTEE